MFSFASVPQQLSVAFQSFLNVVEDDSGCLLNNCTYVLFTSRSLEQVRLSFQVAQERMLRGEERPDTRDIDSENDSQMSSEDGQEANFGSMPIWSVSNVGASVSSTGN